MRCLEEESRKTGNVYEVLLDALGNSTKTSILLLLSRRKKLTVTQMSKYIKVTRSNLYHFVGEMVRDGLIAEPEVVVRKNHIEKYYSQNQQFWKAIDPFTQEKLMMESLTLEEGRKLLTSVFLSLSLQFRMYANEFMSATDEEVARAARQFEIERLMISIWSVNDKVYDMVIPRLRRLLKDVISEEEKRPEEMGLPGGNGVYIVGLPRLFDADE